MFRDPIRARDVLLFDGQTTLFEHIRDVLRCGEIGRRPNRTAPDLDSQVFHVFQRAIGNCFQISLPGSSQGHRVRAQARQFIY